MGTHPIFESDFDCLTGMKFDYPTIAKSDFVEDFHGVQIADPYRPLEEPDADVTKEFVTQQNVVFKKYLENLDELKTKIRAKQTAAFNYEKFGCPKKYGDLSHMKLTLNLKMT